MDCGTSGTILNTIDGGTTWGLQTSGTTETLQAVHFADNLTGWAVGHIGTILNTTDGGASWYFQSCITTRIVWSVYFVNNTTGWAVADSGLILHTTTGGVVSVEEEDQIDEIPTRYSLTQNYPNPFNPYTKIKYQIPELSFITLTVYDVLGNEVTTLVNEEKTVGSYEVEFEASQLTSGIYFYTLQAGEFIQTKKMLILK